MDRLSRGSIRVVVEGEAEGEVLEELGLLLKTRIGSRGEEEAAAAAVLLEGTEVVDAVAADLKLLMTQIDVSSSSFPLHLTAFFSSMICTYYASRK